MTEWQYMNVEYPLKQTLERISDLCKKNWFEYFKPSEGL